jgi:hypothetical protein
MQNFNTQNSAANVSVTFKGGKPSEPSVGKQPFTEKRISDPSSSAPKGERYPIPSFFEYRIKAKDFDTL